MKSKNSSTKTDNTNNTNRMRDWRKPTYACDLETSVYEGQTSTEAWSCASVRLYTEDVHVQHSMDEFMEYFIGMNRNCVLYFHNLKFDGNFILSWLMTRSGYVEAIENDCFLHTKDMPDGSYKYLISLMGDWYTITIKTRTSKVIEIRDSLKLLPFSLAAIGDSFKTKHRKLEMEYVGERHAGCDITESEMEYIRNDVLVLKEALEIMFGEGHDKLTIGSCCLDEFKHTMCPEDYATWLPNLYERELDKDTFGSSTAGEYIRGAYRGGWCYVAKGKENRVFGKGLTLDVNSLYPSMMHSESGNYYPIGDPHFWTGEIPEEARKPERYFFVRIRTRFKIKPGKLPFIQIKNSFSYNESENLTTSDIAVTDPKTGKKKYVQGYINPDGSWNDGRVELTLTGVDYDLICEHYRLTGCEILDGCWFYAAKGIFDLYIEKYKKMKQENTGALRQLAKLFLNNLYGKMGTSPDSSYKIAYLKDDGTIAFRDVRSYDKRPGYIPIGAAITSYARRFTITAAQKNYHGVDKPGFIYADTDSIHCDLPLDEVKGVNIHPKAFCCWAHESDWDHAIFARQKTYIEHMTHTDEKELETPYYLIKAAGMPARCKFLLNLSLTGTTPTTREIKLSTKEQSFVSVHRTLEDFRPGLLVPGKLVQKRIPGGCVLYTTTFKMK